MNDDFEIETIDVRTGHYIFCNGKSKRNLDQITEEQLIKYMMYLSDQTKQASSAIILKVQRKNQE